MLPWRRFSAACAAICTIAILLATPRAAHRAHLSLDLVAREARHTTVSSRVILRGTDIASVAARHHLQVLNVLADGVVVAADSGQLSELAADEAVTALSGDLPVRPSMTVSNGSTGADQVRAGSPGLLGIGAIPGVTGQGVVVAVIDSGITPHAALTNKIIANVSLVTGDPSYLDAFGHGTHVAGIIAGTGGPAAGVTTLYAGGVAPGASLVNVRVLGADGTGLTSDVIAGIDWTIANAGRYNIKIINLSLGHPVTEPALLDPLDQAVARAVNAGLIVFAAAGNYGVDATGAPVLGGVTVPGNSPLAITVGAVNTQGTVKRSDDTLAAYSSRGPTKYDFAVKPDLAAPGNKIVSLENTKSYLSKNYSFLHVAGTSGNAYFRLSGTSMATPMVSGAAALLLQGNPGMSAAQMKLALQMGATYMPKAGLVGAGAGSANFWASRKLALSGLGSLPVTVIAGLTTQASGAAFWDSGTLANRLWGGVGMRLLSLLQLPLVWLDPSLLHDGDLNLAGLTNTLSAVAPNPLIWGEVATWTGAADGDQVIWGTQIYNPAGQQVIWGTDAMEGDQVIWGTTLTDPDAQ